MRWTYKALVILEEQKDQIILTSFLLLVFWILTLTASCGKCRCVLNPVAPPDTTEVGE